MQPTLDSLCKFMSHGVYVIGVNDQHQDNAFTAAWVMQVSFNPVMLAFSINPHNRSYALLQSGQCCSINVLGKNQLALADHFGRTGLTDKMHGYDWQRAKSGAPILSQSLVYFDCNVSHFAPAGDHEIVVCNVVEAGLLNFGEPMQYRDTDDMDGASALYGERKKS